MARLTRKNINVFAGSASNNGVFGSLQAGNATVSNDVETIQSLSEAWSGGWNYATLTGEKLPPLEEFQGVQYVTTYQQAYLMQEGVPEWSATVTYYKGCLTKEVTSTGFRIYNSLTDNNAGNLLSDTSNWKKVMDSDDLYAFDDAVVHKTGAETISGAKTFSVSPIVPTATSGDSSTKAASTEFVTTSDSSLQTQINQKANISDVVNLTGTQTISGTKTFTGGLTIPSYTIIAKQDNNLEGGEITFQRANNDTLAQDPKIDLYNGLMRFLHCNGVVVPASDTINCAVNTTYKSIDGNSQIYCFMFGNGLKIQFGRALNWNNNECSVTFPAPFTGAVIPVCTYLHNGTISSSYGHTNVGNITLTGMSIYRQTSDDVLWIAIGF